MSTIAFVFPGQGSQYVGMGAGLAMEFRAALGVWDHAAALDLEAGATLHETVFPRPGFGAEKEKGDLARLTATQWAQPAIACVSLSQLALLREIGIAADLTGGHSLGEVVALRAAGVLSSDADLLTVARRRGELMAEAAAIPGAMTALSLPVGTVRELLARLAPRGRAARLGRRGVGLPLARWAHSDPASLAAPRRAGSRRAGRSRARRRGSPSLAGCGRGAVPLVSPRWPLVSSVTGRGASRNM